MHRSEFRRHDPSSGTRSQKRPIACHRCHSQKVKCSGEKPCSRCQRAGYTTQCRYTNRDRKIRVDESYLEQLIQDSQELQDQRTLRTHGPPAPSSYLEQRRNLNDHSRQPEDVSSIIHDNAVGETPWFQSLGSSALPLYISEAACTAFATRLCQCLSTTDSPEFHLPRWRYTDENTLESLFNIEVQWPSLVHAKLLVKTALGHLNPAFHLVLRKETFDGLHNIYQRRDFDDPGLQCKYFALFAVGQAFSSVYDTTTLNTSSMPGSAFFARAMNLLQIIPERSSMNHIESILLLVGSPFYLLVLVSSTVVLIIPKAYFCQFLNRFHSAYILIGNALRLSLSLGLNYNVPQSQTLHQVEREHRVRIWWTIYTLDRFWGSKAGFPVQIHDDDVHVDPPSNLLSGAYPEHFSDSVYQVATVELARIIGNTTREIYSRKKSTESFLQREQKLLIQLKQWVQTLPENLRLQADRPNSKYAVFLHVQFSYCVILAIRPVLLNLLVCHTKDNSSPANEEITPIIGVLSEACIHAARYCLKLCVEEWTSGSVLLFGYAFPAFLFSSALVLTISSLLPLGDPNDIASVDIATEILRVLSASNSLAAKDLYEHLQRVRLCLSRRVSDPPLPPTNDENMPFITDPSIRLPLEHHCPSPVSGASMNYRQLPIEEVANPLSPYLTTEMTLRNPLMQDFLAQSSLNVGSWDAPEIPNDFDAAFFWSGTMCTE